MAQTHLKNIALVGASGNIGSFTLKYLLEAGTFNVTAISREGSTATFPSSPNLTVRTGDYHDSAFLEAALQGQDALILTFHFFTPPEVQNNFIHAAAKAGIPFIIPNEYSSDPLNKRLADEVQMIGSKVQYRDLIEKLGKSAWIGIATGFWLDYGLTRPPYLGVNMKDRKAELLDDGNTPVVYTTVAQTGRAITRLLSLPIQTPAGGGPSISDYKNNFVYTQSFTITQNQILAAAQRATKTTAADWNVTFTPVEQHIKEGKDMLAAGNRMGTLKVFFGTVMTKGLANEHFGREVANTKLGLQDENYEEVIERAYQVLMGSGDIKAFA